MGLLAIPGCNSQYIQIEDDISVNNFGMASIASFNWIIPVSSPPRTALDAGYGHRQRPVRHRGSLGLGRRVSRHE